MNRDLWPHRAALVTGVAGILVLAACGASNPSTGSTGTTAPPSTTSRATTSTGMAATTTASPGAGDRALAVAINLTKAELPAGWSPAAPASAVVLNKAACGLAATDSAAQNSPTYTLVGSGEQARSEVGVATASTIAADFALFRGPQGVSCVTKFIEQLNAGPVTISAVSPLAAMTTVAGVAIPMTSFHMAVKPTLPTASAPITADAALIFSGRFEVFVLFTGANGPVAESTQTSAIRAINAKISAVSA
jgi:hypothetical protein